MFINRVVNRGLTGGLSIRSGIKAGQGDGGAGGGNGGGNGAGGNGGLSQEALDLIESRFTSMLQGGISSMQKRLEKQQGEKIDALMKAIEGAKVAPKPQADPDVDPDEGGKRARRNKDDVDFQTMQQRLQTQEQLMESLKRERDLERNKNRQAHLRSASSAILSNYGITDPINQDLAITNLIAKGVLSYEADESDRIVWHDPTGVTFEAQEGFRSWIRSPEAQRLLPASGARGSGSSRGNGGNGRGSDVNLTPEQQSNRVFELLRDADFTQR